MSTLEKINKKEMPVTTQNVVKALNEMGGGSEGTKNYNDLENKPSINGQTLEGNVTINVPSMPTLILGTAVYNPFDDKEYWTLNQDALDEMDRRLTNNEFDFLPFVLTTNEEPDYYHYELKPQQIIRNAMDYDDIIYIIGGRNGFYVHKVDGVWVERTI